MFRICTVDVLQKRDIVNVLTTLSELNQWRFRKTTILSLEPVRRELIVSEDIQFSKQFSCINRYCLQGKLIRVTGKLF
jgi:hypothetical protein